MKRYREFMSRGECLLNALIWSIIPGLQILFYVRYGGALPQDSRIYFLILLLLQLLGAALHWYRYLAYDKK